MSVKQRMEAVAAAMQLVKDACGADSGEQRRVAVKCVTCWRPTRSGDGQCHQCRTGEAQPGLPTAEEMADWQEMKRRMREEFGMPPVIDLRFDWPDE